ncbi:ankyrin repeat domain-containing protein 50, partial [Carlito syrichta]|uniref:Ankyrin repeat domain-containing protein 50 n=1 Tax=Carlito syrichta TaxID=1868482 RepID=A0A3Q0EEK8_CARSF
WEENVCRTAQTSLLQGKRFYCREWAFHKLQHCLQEKAGCCSGAAPAPALLPDSGDNAGAAPARGASWGVLLVGGPGSGKTALCTELLWPSSPAGLQRGLHRQALAFHFCTAQDSDTLCVGAFVRGLVAQICRSGLLQGYEDRLREPAAQSLLRPGECERNPAEAFKRCVLLPLLGVKPPQQSLYLLVDSVDEGCSIAEGEQGSSSLAGTVAELLAGHHEFFPPWLLLLCSARKQSRAVTKMFTGFRKISLDDLRKAYIVKDVQQYILHRLDQEEALRQHLTKETAEMLNQLHIKSSGCFLYLERVLDGVVENFIMLREIRDIPGTLNGLYLWLCQRLFVRKQFAKVQPVLNVILAACRPLTVTELYHAVWTKNMSLSLEDFQRKLDVLSKLLVDGLGDTKILFHYSFAEWLLDVKHCTQKYLCNAAEGHRMLAMSYTCQAKDLTPWEAQEFALHLISSNLQLETAELALWMIWNGTPVRDSLSTSIPKEQEVLQLLVKAGAHVDSEDDRTSGIVRQALEREDSIRTLLDNGAAVNQCDASGRTLLASAAYSGSLDVVNLLVSRGADSEIEDAHGHTPLTLAARQGHTKVVNCLIGCGADINHTDHDGWTALRSAAWGGHTEVVSALLYAGVKVDCADADSRTALRAAAWGGHEDIVLNLLQHGAEVNKADNEGRTALIAAAYMGHREIVGHLLDHGAEVNHEDVDGRTALSVAALCVPASKGHASVVGLLVDRGAEVDHCDKDGMTPLLVAAYEGHVDVVDLLLEGGADVDHTDHNGRTPLLAAASMGHASVVNTLLFWGAAVDSIDSEGRTVLSIASAQGNVEVVRTLLDRGLDENHRDDAGWTPLHMAAFEGHRLICEALIEQGARTNETDNDGRIPFVLAAQEGHYDCVQVLLESKSSVDQRGYDGRNALRVAALEGHRDIVELLLSHGADVDCRDADGRPTLYILALENQLAMAELLLESGADVEAGDAEGRTALHVSCWQGHVEMVRVLVACHADVNAADNEKRSALQSAAWQGHVKVVRLLVEHGAAVDHTCNQGATALCIAAQEGHLDVVQVLLEHGADPNHADQFGRTAMRVAAKNGHAQIITLLEQYGAASLNGWSGHGAGRWSEAGPAGARVAGVLASPRVRWAGTGRPRGQVTNAAGSLARQRQLDRRLLLCEAEDVVPGVVLPLLDGNFNCLLIGRGQKTKTVRSAAQSPSLLCFRCVNDCMARIAPLRINWVDFLVSLVHTLFPGYFSDSRVQEGRTPGRRAASVTEGGDGSDGPVTAASTSWVWTWPEPVGQLGWDMRVSGKTLETVGGKELPGKISFSKAGVPLVVLCKSSWEENKGSRLSDGDGPSRRGALALSSSVPSVVSPSAATHYLFQNPLCRGSSSPKTGCNCSMHQATYRGGPSRCFLPRAASPDLTAPSPLLRSPQEDSPLLELRGDSQAVRRQKHLAALWDADRPECGLVGSEFFGPSLQSDFACAVLGIRAKAPRAQETLDPVKGSLANSPQLGPGESLSHKEMSLCPGSRH